MKPDAMKCLACSVNVNHSEEQHNDYLAIWCSQHNSWCGDHTQKTILEALNNLKRRHKSAYSRTGALIQESAGLEK
jgi:hypothetical protein